MSRKDREHFKQYRDQTRVKHEVLRKYVPAFFHVLKSYHKNLVYIDGFAGRGTYDITEDATVDGSPLHALKVISENSELSDKVTTIFIETDRENYERLDSEIKRFRKSNSQIRKPQCHCGTFSDCINNLLDEINEDDADLAPCFVFVDPCGIEGASMKAITRVLEYDRCEAFIFFNLDGVRRVCGLDNVSETLVELYGTAERAFKLSKKVKSCNSALEKEEVMLSEYMQAIRDENGEKTFVTPFRIEHERRKITSHYLIHVTKHPLGFKIMKDVMWKLGSSDEGGGGLGLVQASKRNENSLLRPNWDAFKDSIVAALRNEPLKVSTFYDTWVMRPDDRFSEPAYREALIELEAQGRIVVLDKNGVDPKPANKRRKIKGILTLGKDYFVAKR